MARALPPALVAGIDRSAAPAEVGPVIDRLVESDPSLPDRLAADPRLLEALLAVLGASRSIARLVETDPGVLDVLGDLDRRPSPPEIGLDELVRWKRHELARIAARDLTALDPVEVTASLLADLATDVLTDASALAEADGIAVIGMGKLGGDELNYASDVDIVLVGDGPTDDLHRRARRLVEVAGHCFRVDTNLRPEGRDGPLVRSLDSYEAYWDRWARPWELQALLKARPVAGDAELGTRFAETAARWLWSHPFDTEDLRELRHLKARAERAAARRGAADRDLKHGPGGIRDIEFAVQLLQLVHGHLDPSLRRPATLPVLAELGRAGYVDPDDAEALTEAYRFLRVVEHRIQLVDERQTHTLPSDDTAVDRLARTTGRRDSAEASAADQLRRTLRDHQLAVRAVHERVWFRPLLEAFSGTLTTLSPEAAVARLQAFGFTDATRTQMAVRELTRGMTRSSRLMHQLLPLLLDWLSASPDPELGLVVLRNLLTGPQRTALLTTTFRDSPDAARALCQLVGTSRLVGEALARNPDLVERLADPDRLQTQPRAELVSAGQQAVGWRRDPAQRLDALRRWNERQLVGIAAREVLTDEDVAVIGRDLTTLAEASVELALRDIDPAVPFAVVAMGRFGGAELSYASDLDVIFAYDGSSASDAEEGRRVATAVVRSLGGSTPATRLYAIDADLRPEGRQGPMARSLDGFRRYWEGWAQPWERQAMVRARPVAGDLDLGAHLLELISPQVWGDGLSGAEELEIRRLKARIESERIPADEDPRFHLKLGRGSLSDIEWTVQLLQLRHGVRATGTAAALGALEEAGHLSADDAEVLGAAYRFCERTRNRWYLVHSAPGDSLPTQPEPLLWLARSLGTTSSDLRQDYRRVTRRARRVVERVFYGQSA